MSLIFFILGYIMASLDVVLGSIDILPDMAGFILLTIGLIPVASARKMSPFHCIWPILGLIFNVSVMIIGSSLGAIILIVLQEAALFMTVLVLSRAMFPDRPKGSTQSLLFQSMLTAQCFLVITNVFAGLLGSVELLAIFVLLFQIIFIIFEVVIVCRRWPARPIY